MDALLVAERLESSGKYSGYRILNPTAQFFHSLYQCSHWDALPNIRWVADCAMIGRSESLDWNAIIKWTEQLQFQSFVPDAMAFLQDEMQVEIPDFVFEELKKFSENSDAAHYFLWTCKPKSLKRFWVGPIRSWYQWKAFTKGTMADLSELFWFKTKSGVIHRVSQLGFG